MYEDITFDSLLRGMLSKIPDAFDKREGSIIYNALAPAAVELQNLYIAFTFYLDQIFADTAARDALIKRCSEVGITPKEATQAILKGEFNQDMPIGSRYSLELLNYEITEKIEDTTYQLRCETCGEEGNRHLGLLIPIDYQPGLTRAELTEVLTPGTDEEETEHLRERYFAKARMPATSGNIYQYLQWATEVVGCGDAKVFPLADGPGTVKVVVADSDMGGASAALIMKVEAHIEELRPIGVDVSVVSVVEKEIRVDVNVLINNGANLESVRMAFQTMYEKFLRRNTFKASYISIAKIGNLLMDVEGVEDYSGLHLNGGSVNVTLRDNEVGVCGTINLGVMRFGSNAV